MRMKESSQLNMAKNYLEQKVELSYGKRSVVFGCINGMVVFHDGENVVAAVKDRTLHIFHEQVKFADLQFPTQCSAVDLDAIKSAKALFCKRCRRWLAFHPILKRCSCGTYLKERKRFYVEETEIENSDELAETIFAIRDVKDAMKIERTKRKRSVRMKASVKLYNSNTASTSGVKMCRNGEWIHKEMSSEELIRRARIERRSYTWFVEKAVIKVNGMAVPDEAKVPLLLSLKIF